MIVYLALMATLGAVSSVLRCWLAWKARDTVRIVDAGTHLKVIER
jgi:hypothetical protein